MTIGRRITIGFAAVTLLAIAGVVAMNQYSMANLAGNAVQAELRGYIKTLKSTISAEARRAESMAALVANIPATERMFAQQDRQGLLDMFVPAFAVLKKDYAVRQFQFHTPPATSFARIHKPEQFGDDLSSFRKTVVSTNTEKKPTVGTEIGVAGLGVRGMVPVFDGGRHLGSVEFGMSFGQAFFDQFKADYGVETALYLKRENEYERFATTFGDMNPLSDAVLDTAFSGQAEKANIDLAGEPMAVLAEPIEDFSGNPIGVVVIGKSTVASSAALAGARMNSFLFAGVAFILVFGLSLLISRSITRPIHGITSVMNRLTSGELETDVPAQERSDEIGVMARSVEVFKESLIEGRRLERERQAIEQRSDEEKKALMTRLSRDFETNVGGVIERVGKFASELQSSAQHLSSVADDANTQTAAVMNDAQLASGNVDAVAAAAEELSASIHEISSQVERSSTVASEAVSEATRTEETVQGLVNTVGKISSVVDLIADITDRTNLLALNATIEAARAGDAGKGFAVVATEVKNLAEQTAKATEEISKQIGTVQSVTGDASHAMEGIVRTIGSIDEISTAIASAVQEQGSATQEIVRNVSHAASGTRNVTDHIQNVASGADETGHAASNMLSAAEVLLQLSQELRGEMQTFMNEIRVA
ncbi:MAG: methyl-accepting chemotaxis protein [Rhodobiaceae bacterium]|nr:methyl-accepting chemotaxis protein [Rhodobiaceae bacterium]